MWWSKNEKRKSGGAAVAVIVKAALSPAVKKGRCVSKLLRKVERMKYEMLFSPMKIGSVTMKNRVVMAPMMLGFGTFDGTATSAMMNYYEERAKGGAGLIITEITRVNDVTGATSFGQLGVSHDYQIPALAEMARRVQKHGAKLFVQLHHPGRQNLGLMMGTVPLCVSMEKALPFYKKMMFSGIVPVGKKLQQNHIVPKVAAPSECETSYFSGCANRGLSHNEVKKLIAQFIEGAVRCQKARVDGVELHAAHGYLIQQFLSPNINHRTDEYGGSLENRMRFLLEIISGIRKSCGASFPIIVRLTVDECYDKIGQPGKGYTLEEGVLMAKRLEEAGVDAIDVSSAAYDTFNYWLEPVTFECGWRKYMAEAVKKAVKIPVLAANLIRSPEQAEAQLQAGIQDFVSLGRPMIADPYWARKAEQGREAEIKRCICCLYCFESMQENAYKGTHAHCAVNPSLGQEGALTPQDGGGRLAAVIGAGVAGLTAAEQLARRGFQVVVLERSNKPGGQMCLADKPPHKEKLFWCVTDLIHAVEKLGAEIRYGVEETEKALRELNPYTVIVATGAVTVRPDWLKGRDLPHVYTVDQILDGGAELHEKKVAVIGSGMTGLETSHYLAEQGNQVTVVEMEDTLAPGVWMQHVDDILPKLEAAGAVFLTSHKLLEITKYNIVLQNLKTEESTSLYVDAVVLSTGVRSENALYEKIKEQFERVYLVGDALRPGRIANATESAYETVKKVQ